MRRRPREEIREEVLAAAARVFARRGFHGASVEAISEDAGLSTGAIYSNFKGNKAIFSSALMRSGSRGAEGS